MAGSTTKMNAALQARVFEACTKHLNALAEEVRALDGIDHDAEPALVLISKALGADDHLYGGMSVHLEAADQAHADTIIRLMLGAAIGAQPGVEVIELPDPLAAGTFPEAG